MPDEVLETQGEGDSQPSGGEDVAKVMEALRKERESNKEAAKKLRDYESQLKVFQGIDPELAKRAEAILKEQEERSQFEARLKGEVEQQYTPQIKALQTEKEAIAQQLLSYQLDTQLERAYGEADGFPGEFMAIAPALRERVKFENGKIKILDTKGNPAFATGGEPMTLPQLIAEMKQNETWFARHFKGTLVNGAGIGGSGQGFNGSGFPEGMSEWEKVNMQRSQRGQ